MGRTINVATGRRVSLLQLIETINAAAGEERLGPQTLATVFDKWWPDLEQQVSEILDSHKEDDPEARRSARDILEEVLELTRIGAKRSAQSPRLSDPS
ncbi:MAG: hypothetical protein IIC86_09925, partial [Chloroflexi bacterium]|nr:hypothetical protein [Chloroflexota bacterium]